MATGWALRYAVVMESPTALYQLHTSVIASMADAVADYYSSSVLEPWFVCIAGHDFLPATEN